MNKVIIMGRLTADPELRQTQSGISNCRFTVAVNRKIKNKETGEYDADFVSCTAWRQTAEFVSRYFNKGSMICLEGSLRIGSYQDRNHPDVTHYTTDVFVDNVEFCGSKSNSSTSGQQTGTTQYAQAGTPQQTAPQAQSQQQNFNNLSDFEEILSDGDVPF